MKRLQTYETLSLLTVALVLMLASVGGSAQRSPYRVFFVDKGADSFVPGSPLYDSTLAQYHPHALERRALAGMNPLLDAMDRPIDRGYLGQILSISDSLLTSNPWFNYAVVGLTPDEVDRVKALDCVKGLAAANSIMYRFSKPEDCSPVPVNYQYDMLRVGKVDELHDAGVFGQGARIGLIDNGFRWKTMSSLSHVNVESEYDFIYRRPTTANQSNDVAGQDEHGSIIMSVAAAWHRDSVMGVAPFGTYLLAKSEDMRYERRIEEDLYVEALWWLERSGVDISSSSLGYRTFDSTESSTPYDLLDGSTTFPARAINLASKRGVICLTAAGNSGPSSQSIITPADADSALAIGAISLDGVTAWSNSSFGPTPKGRQKPEFAAPGQRVPVQQLNGAVGRASGTSLATPYAAAQVALLRQLYPSAHPSFLRQAMVQASSYGVNTDSVLGHGAIDVARAARLLGPSVPEPAVVVVSGKMVILAPIFSPDTVEPVLYQRPRTDAAEIAINGVHVSGDWYAFTLRDELFTADVSHVRIVVSSKVTGRTFAYPVGAETMRVQRNFVSVPCGMRLPSTIVSVNDDLIASSHATVAGVPLSADVRELVVHGLREAPLSVRLVHAVTGMSVPCSIARHDAGSTSVIAAMSLPTGTWFLECHMNGSVLHLPLLVL
ncbi:MAG: hypothetical protein FGM33_03110 [Candidatus Kapabacteria bacterium]|nr:hypothetical protein [Candidatus Kapabacteria bacterium]